MVILSFLIKNRLPVPLTRLPFLRLAIVLYKESFLLVAEKGGGGQENGNKDRFIHFRPSFTTF